MSSSSILAEAAEDKESQSSSQRSSAMPKMHSFLVNGTQFIIDTIYQPLKPIGTGAYGVVCSALDKTSGKKVAIKKITRAFDDLVDAKRVLREMKLLRHFNHENIVGLVDLCHPALGHDFEDIYMVLDFMETDLHKIIYSKNQLTDEHIQYFIYQILRGLKYIHSANVIHRDLKPSNLLLNGNCDLKICDFGLARGVNDIDHYELTEYVVTRWYRAPEVMCACQQYDEKIDVWSVGCIMAELHGRKPLFPGEDYIQQMNLMFSVLGTPSEEDMAFITNPKAIHYIRGLGRRPPVPWTKTYKNANPLAMDLLSKMLVFNPKNRISVQEALEHPYLRNLHLNKPEVDCKQPFNFEFEKIKMDKKALQAFTLEEIVKFRPYLVDQRQFTPFLTNLAMYHEQLNQAGYLHHIRDMPPLPEHILQMGKVQLAQLQAAQLPILVNPNAHGPNFAQMQQAQYQMMMAQANSANTVTSMSVSAPYGTYEQGHGQEHVVSGDATMLDENRGRLNQGSYTQMELDPAVVRMAPAMAADNAMAHKYAR